MSRIIDYRYGYQKENKRKKPHLFIAIIFILILLFVWFLGKNLFVVDKPVTMIISPLPQKIISPMYLINNSQNSKNLEKIINAVLKENKNNYAIEIENLKTGERYYLNENKKFDSASLYKLWIMAVIYQKIENGELDPDQVLTEEVEFLNEKFNLATESAELTEGTISWPIKTALQKMITISDNYSALLLTSKIRLSSVTNFLTTKGFFQSKVGSEETNPITSADDIRNFLKKLYYGELANKENTNEMLNLLKGQLIDTKLSKYLSDDTAIGHKTGELGEYSHDAGIVYSKKGDYIIVIMSKTSNRKVTDEKIAQISKEVYNYFVN